MLCTLVVEALDSGRFLPFTEIAVFDLERLLVGMVCVCGPSVIYQ
jgi:hypothetical protein